METRSIRSGNRCLEDEDDGAFSRDAKTRKSRNDMPAKKRRFLVPLSLSLFGAKFPRAQFALAATALPLTMQLITQSDTFIFIKFVYNIFRGINRSPELHNSILDYKGSCKDPSKINFFKSAIATLSKGVIRECEMMTPGEKVLSQVGELERYEYVH